MCTPHKVAYCFCSVKLRTCFSLSNSVTWLSVFVSACLSQGHTCHCFPLHWFLLYYTLPEIDIYIACQSLSIPHPQMILNVSGVQICLQKKRTQEQVSLRSWVPLPNLISWVPLPNFQKISLIIGYN